MTHKIKYINHGIGHVIDDTIYINQDLLNYPKLYTKVLNHELRHLAGIKDVDKNEKFDPELFMWVLNNIKSWSHFLPIVIYGKNKIAYSPRYCKIWIFCIIWLIIMIKVFQWISMQ